MKRAIVLLTILLLLLVVVAACAPKPAPPPAPEPEGLQGEFKDLTQEDAVFDALDEALENY